MEIPDRILIGYKLVDIVLKDLDDAEGMYLPDKGQILLDPKQHEQEFANTFIHELLHAIWGIYDLSPKETEEKAVTILANGLTQVFLNSPEILDYLVHKIKDQRGRI